MSQVDQVLMIKCFPCLFVCPRVLDRFNPPRKDLCYRGYSSDEIACSYNYMYRRAENSHILEAQDLVA